MSLNCNEINKILEELDLEGSFIQDIIQPTFDQVAFYTYKTGGKTVMVCTAQDSTRINETRRKITKNEKPLRFMEFLKSRIKGARINKIEQIGLERIIRMELSHTGENFLMYIRLWNNAANILLCDENNRILDAMFRRPNKDEMVGEIFPVPVADESKFAQIDRWPVRTFDEIREEYEALPQSKYESWESLSFNAKVDLFYSEHARSLSRAALLEKAEKWYITNHTKRLAALENLEKKLDSFKNAEMYRHQGDLILSFGHLMDGASKALECEDYESGKIVQIMVDPKKSAQENANDYYSRYKKAVSGSEELKNDIELAKEQIELLDKQYEQIKNEPNPIKIEQLLRKDSTPKQQQKKAHPGLDYTVNGWYILVGRDANENDELLRHHVRGDDMWLHTRDYPGGYVFIKHRKDKTVPLDILLDAGNLAVYFSKARGSGKTDLYYTHVKYLRRAKNGPKGLVLPTHEKNLCITPDPERLKRLERQKNS